MAKKKAKGRSIQSAAQSASVAAYKHIDDSRKNIPTAEMQSGLSVADQSPIRVKIERRNRDLDPQLVWRGKDEQDWSELVVQAPPLFIQEKIHPKALIDDLLRRSQQQTQAADPQGDLFADFNGFPTEGKTAEFYQHEGKWQNRMILGDSLQVMASLAEREGLRGQVQCIYFDPPYGIKFNSNFQWSTTSRDVKDGNAGHITREPEQVKAFRDTWRDGSHSYLTYLRDRLTVARDLLTESGSIFVQIGDENVHRVRAVMDEVLGETNLVTTLVFSKTASQTSRYVAAITDFVLWYAKDIEKLKYRSLFEIKGFGGESADRYDRGLKFDGSVFVLRNEIRLGLQSLPEDVKAYSLGDLTSQRQGRSTGPESAMGFPVEYEGRSFSPTATRGWSTTKGGIDRLMKAGRIEPLDRNLRYRRVLSDFPASPRSNVWTDVTGVQSRSDPKIYVVQTATSAIQRCVLMATDPGDLVLDPTCGSGTTAYVAEQWGRRWITIDTSRVALALARARIMGARYPYYLLADSREGQLKEAEITRTTPSDKPTHGNIRHGFVYERVPHITLKAIANNTEIDEIWERMQPAVEKALADLNAALAGHKKPFKVETGGRAGKTIDFTAKAGQTVKMPSGEDAPANAMLEWEVPREAPADWPKAAEKPLAAFWKARIARQKEIDASIAAKAEYEFLYDRPYEDKKRVRVAGPFTVESLSPHRVLTVDENDTPIEPGAAGNGHYAGDERDFAEMVLEHLRTAGVQQSAKSDRISFSSVEPWPGKWICAKGEYIEGGTDDGSTAGTQRRAGIFIGPEFGTVSKPDLVAATREAGDAGFDVLIACAFNFDAHASEFSQLGRIPVLKARMNADLHMAGDLANTGKGNLFVIFGEPDIDIQDAGNGQIQVKINGVDVFNPSTGEIRSDDVKGIACWFIDTDYNEESFFVRHAYFLGAATNDPYKALKTTLRAEINEDAWATLNSDTSRPFAKPTSGRIAVKVINHLGDEVMKVFRIDDTPKIAVARNEKRCPVCGEAKALVAVKSGRSTKTMCEDCRDRDK